MAAALVVVTAVRAVKVACALPTKQQALFNN